MAMFDREMRYLIANQRWLREFRLDKTEILGRSHFEVFPSLHDSWREIYERCLAGYVERCEEDILERDDGTRDWVRWELRPWRLANFSVGGIIISCEIVTPIKKAEQALRDDHDLADALMQGNSPVVILDATGHIIRHSRGALQFADARSVIGGTLKGMSFSEAFPIHDEPEFSFADRLQKLCQRRHGLKISEDRLVSHTRMADEASLEISWALSPHIDEHGILTQIVLTGIPRPLDPRHPPTAPPTFAAQPSAEPAQAAATTLSKLSVLAGLSHPDTSTQANRPLHGGTADEQATEATRPEDSDQASRASLLVAKHAPLGLVLLDPEASILYANDQIGRILGSDLSPGDSIEQWLCSGCPDDHYAEEVVSEWRDNIWCRQLKRILTLANTDRLLKEIEFRPSLLEDGNLLVAIVDVTETQRAEEALRASENRLRGLFDNTPAAIALVDPSGYIFDANHSLETLLGRSRLELRRTSFDELIAEIDLERKHEITDKMRREGTASTTIDLKLCHGSGDLVPARLHIAKNTTSEDRLAFTSYLMVARDREEALTEKLVESQLQNQALLSASREAVFLVDRESRAVLDLQLPENFPAASELQGLRGSRFAVTMPEIDGPLSQFLVHAPRQTDPPQLSRTIVLQRTEGRPLRLDMRITPVDARRVLLMLACAAPYPE